MQASDYNRLVNKVRDRRRFLAGAGIASVAAFAGSKLAISPARAATGLTATDVEVLNFALNLEYLEAEFYLRASNNSTLAADQKTGTGTRGVVSGGSKVPFSNPSIQALADELAVEESLHVAYIRSTLEAYGYTPVAQPAIDLDTSFTTLAQSAGLIQPGQTFNPFENDVNFLLGAYIFEDVGVTAYAGAAGLVSSTILSAAAGIMAVEAYHAGAIRMLAYNNELAADTNMISNLRATLDGTATSQAGPDDFGIIVRGSQYGVNRITDRNDEGMAFSRTTSQVLSIVYGNQINSNGTASASSGLFFPNGMNGTIH